MKKEMIQLLNKPQLINNVIINDEFLQRTNQWRIDRRGRFTGSRNKELMSCGQSTSKKPWGEPEKLIDFGETAKKYIFEKAMERKRNMNIKTPSTKSMDYGTEGESTVKSMLPYDVEEVGFIEFIKGIAGASPDGKVDDENGLEIKCPSSWNGLYQRIAIDIDEKHMDFWQLQSEMLALRVPKIIYVVAEPCEDIDNPNIEYYHEFVVDESPIHQKCLIQRCMIANTVIEYFLAGISFSQALQKSCSEFDMKVVHKEPEKIVSVKSVIEVEKINIKDVPF